MNFRSVPRFILSLFLLYSFTLILAGKARAVYCDPPLSGNWTIESACVLYEDVNGPASGDITLNTGISLTIHKNKTLVWYPGKKITIPAGANIIVDNTGQIKQAYICTKESGTATGYAVAKTSTDPRTDNFLYLGLDQAVSTTTTDTTTDPVAWWKFDDNTGQTAIDSSGNSITATLINTPTWATGRLGYAVSLSTASQQYATATNIILDNIIGAFSLSAWVYRTGAGNTQVISKIGAVGTGGYAMLIGNQGEVYCRTDNISTYQDSYTATGKVPASTWTHLAVVRNGTSCRVYINGVDSTSIAASHTLSINTNAVNIGARSGTPQDYFPGRIDDVRVYNRNLSASEISTMYSSNCAVGYKRREDFLSKDVVDMGTTGASGALATIYRYLLNLGMAVSSINSGVREVIAASNLISILGDNLKICITSPCTLATPADYGNLIVERNVGIGTGAPGYALHVAGGTGTDIRVEGSTNPRFSHNQTGGGTDQKRWQNYATTNTLLFTALNDAESAETPWLRVNRGTGTAISGVAFPNGNVGIGTISPASLLSLGTSYGEGIANKFRLYDDGGASTSDTSNSSGIGIRGSDGRIAYTAGTGGYHAFYTANTERMRVASTGNVGIGTGTPLSPLQMHSTGGQTTAAITDAGSKNGLLTVTTSGTGVGDGGGILFGAYTEDNYFAAIKTLLQNGGTNTAGDLAFSTRNAATDTALTERMRITYGGNVGIGTTGPLSKLSVGGVGSAEYAIYGNGTYGVFGTGSAGGVYGYSTSGAYGVVGQNTSTGYGVYCAAGSGGCGGNQPWSNVSDRKLKENITPIDNALVKVLNLQGVTYNLKSDPAKTPQMGFIAQDVLPYVPEVVSYDKNNGYYGMQTSQLTALLVVAVKEQQAQISGLKKEIEGLKTIIKSSSN